MRQHGAVSKTGGRANALKPEPSITSISHESTDQLRMEIFTRALDGTLRDGVYAAFNAVRSETYVDDDATAQVHKRELATSTMSNTITYGAGGSGLPFEAPGRLLLRVRCRGRPPPNGPPSVGGATFAAATALEAILKDEIRGCNHGSQIQLQTIPKSLLERGRPSYGLSRVRGNADPTGFPDGIQPQFANSAICAAFARPIVGSPR